MDASVQNETGEKQKTRKKAKNNKKKKPSKKDRKKQQGKEKNMQDLFPFRDIGDSYIEMENGDFFLYLRIRANCLDLLSLDEIHKLISSYGKEIDRDKYNVGYFIQDGSFNIQGNIRFVRKAKEKQKNAFLKLLLDQEEVLLKSKQQDTNKKLYCIVVHIRKKAAAYIKIEEVIGRLKNIYKDTLNPVACTKEEIKYMLAVFANRIFCDDLPDTEIMEIEEEEQRGPHLLIRQKKTFKEMQIPGIYSFKDMIVPYRSEFTPSNGRIGRNIIRIYAISSFLGSTKETNLLQHVCNMAGVTTKIYIEPLKLRKYKENMRQDIRSKRSAVKDEVDLMDFEHSKETMADTYRSTLDKNQNMYYISVYFMLTAKTQHDFDELEEKFLGAIDDVSISVDELQAREAAGYRSISPIGHNELGAWVKQNIPAESVANLYPFNEPSLLDANGLYIGNIVDKKHPTLFTPFAYRGTNNNILILGMSGVGKTILMMLILMNAAAMNAYIRNIDFEGTQREFIEKMGGINIDIAGGEFAINILQVRIPDKIRLGILDDYIGEVKGWARTYKPQWNDNHLDLFEEFMRRAYLKKGITNDTDFSTLLNTDYPTLSDIYDEIETEWKRYDPKKSLASETELKTLMIGLNSAVKGADQMLFNRHTFLGAAFNQGEYGRDVFRSVKIINFDFSRMMASDKPRKLAQWQNIFTYITQFVNSNIEIRDDIIVSIDEMHEMLHKENLSVINIISSYERRFRKYNTCFLKSTQTMDEVDSNDAELEAKVKPLFSQSATKFLFHLGDIDYDKPKRLMNLTSSEISKLQESRSGQCLMRVNHSLYDVEILMPDWFKTVKKDVSTT